MLSCFWLLRSVAGTQHSEAHKRLGVLPELVGSCRKLSHCTDRTATRHSCPAPAAAGEASPALVQTLSHCRPLPRQRTARGRYLHRHALSQLRAREAYGNFPSILKSMHTRFTAGKLGTRHGELAVRSHRACVSEGWDSCPLPDNDRTIMTALSLK